MKMIPTFISFYRDYMDSSGVQYGAEYRMKDSRESVKLICNSESIVIPLDEVDWFISRLQDIKEVVNPDSMPEVKP